MTPRITIDPPLVNTSNPWATSLEDLRKLYNLQTTGAVTTRTALLTDGFAEDSSIHQHAFFARSSINSYGYSPHPLSFYLATIKNIVKPASSLENSSDDDDDDDNNNNNNPNEANHNHNDAPQRKPFIVSVTGTAIEIVACVAEISSFAKENTIELLCEINLSCPNIPNKAPPAYSTNSIKEYLYALRTLQETGLFVVPLGIKTPPYTFHGQFVALISAVEAFPKVLSFMTATNTLGNSLMFDLELEPTIMSEAGTGVGGMGGENIHALSLGNVFSIRRLLDESKVEGVKDIVVIGCGGVSDSQGAQRMRKAGASVVGIGTAFGREGIQVFDHITESMYL